MKRIVFFLSLLVGVSSFSQQKSTGDMTLSGNGMIANFTLDNTTSKVTLVLKGPSDRWFGFGIGVDQGFSMSAGDALVYTTQTTPALTDRNFSGIMQPPVDATQNWTIVSDNVNAGIRTLTLTRDLTNSDTNDYQLPYSTTNTINIAGVRPGSATFNVASGHGGVAGYATGTFASVLGTNDLAIESKKVVLYPNPAKATVSFKNFDKIKSVDIYDAVGRKVKSVKPESESMSVEDLRPGNYYIEIMLKDGNLSYEKLIKE